MTDDRDPAEEMPDDDETAVEADPIEPEPHDEVESPEDEATPD